MKRTQGALKTSPLSWKVKAGDIAHMLESAPSHFAPLGVEKGQNREPSLESVLEPSEAMGHFLLASTVGHELLQKNLN